MPATWEFRGSVLVVTLAGKCKEEATTAINEAMADPAFKPGTSLLLDVRRATDPTPDELRRRAKSLGSRPAKGLSSRCAIGVGPKAHQFGLGRMAAIYSDSYGMQVEIFTDLDEAICWLESTAAAGAAAAP